MRYICIMKKIEPTRTELEKNYWNTAANHPDVEQKYICDIGDHERNRALGEMDGRVLEIGCGIGRLLKPHWFGIDISQRMINLAKNLKPICNYAVCDGRTIPFEDEYFDHVYCVLVFQHIPFEGVVAYIKETARVLKDNGTFRFQFIEGDEDAPFSKHHSMKEMRKALKDAGLAVTHIKKGFGHSSWVWVHAKKTENEVKEEVYLESDSLKKAKEAKKDEKNS